MARKIPSIMVSQHPDNAFAPSWKEDPFISTYDETEECYRAFHDLGCDEYMWDWEGKLVDEAVVDRLLRKYHEYFKKKQLGRDVFLTYRIPNVRHEPGYRLARAYMGILSAEEFVHELKLHAPPIFEVILPMTESASDLLQVQKTFAKVAAFKSEVFEQKLELKRLSVIPLFEGVDNLLKARDTIAKYVTESAKYFGQQIDHLRPFVARSDPALNSGIVATTLAIKVALSDFDDYSSASSIPLYPIIGPGGLPFRGHLSPLNIEHFVHEYAGVRTAVVQSSFRYDYDAKQVSHAIRYLQKKLPVSQVLKIARQDRAKVTELIRIFEKHYQSTVEKIAPCVNEIAGFVPSRRERMQHIGLLGYSRKLGKKSLPRAIKFTGALYALGIPPEMIGVGRGLKEAHKKGLMPVLHKYYLNFFHDLKTAGYFLNRENLQFLVNDKKSWWDIQQDVRLIEELTDIELGPRSVDHYIHRNSTSNVYFLWQDKQDISREIEWSARYRKSIG